MTPCLSLFDGVRASDPPDKLKAAVAALMELYADVDKARDPLTTLKKLPLDHA